MSIGTSVGGLLGIGNTSGNYVSPQTGNQSLGTLNAMGGFSQDPQQQDALERYSLGQMSQADALNNISGLSGAEQVAGYNQLATGALTGSKYATEQVQNNPLLGQMFGSGGQLQKGIGLEDAQVQRLNDLQNQGFQLQPEDMTQYGQTSGNISRLFGQQGNQAASDLASRGLSSSGAAGATFSGIAGNQNEQLAQAQQQIMQQRFQNTQNQIANTQNFIQGLQGNVGNLGNEAQNAIQGQYSRQLSGAQQSTAPLIQMSGLNMGQNQMTNQSNLAAAGFQAATTPSNILDIVASSRGGNLLGGMFGGSGTKNPNQPDNSAGGGASGAAAAGSAAEAASDINLKTDIKYADSDIEELLSTIIPYLYKYKDVNHGEGWFISPMAQDLEKSKIGKGLVVETPEGKFVSYGRMMGLILSTQAYLFKKGMM